jgi:hypothetical protein
MTRESEQYKKEMKVLNFDMIHIKELCGSKWTKTKLGQV